MFVTLKWLKEYVDIEESAQEIAELLTFQGLEISDCAPVRTGLDKVITSRIISIDRHPEADKLTVCRMDTGSGESTVVCGAQNISTGDIVPLALPGACLPGEKVIEAASLRGVLSEGMLCSENELSFSEDHHGIMLLPSDTQVGQSLDGALNLEDDLLELEITPNRPDCLSVIGVAREIAAKKQRTLRLPQISLKEDSRSADMACSIELSAPEACHRYVARVLEGIQIAPSPFWLRRLLSLVGLRPINNIVDVTNFVMWEWGQPLHAFDLDCLAEQRIVVRKAESGQRITTLDGAERKLCEDDLLICDAQRPVALAGIMGGQDSEISDGTTRILLESAFFEPRGIRRSSKRLGLSTESSYRFEREIDIQSTLLAADRASDLMLSLSQGKLLAGAVDIYPKPYQPKSIRLHFSRLDRLLGTSIEKDHVPNYLKGLEIECKNKDEEGLDAIPPSFRPDIAGEVDIIEEVARLYGYDAIPTHMPEASISVILPDPEQKTETRIRDTLVGMGFYEVINYSFYGKEQHDLFKYPATDRRSRPVSLQNPLNETQSFLRTTLLGSLLDTMSRNIRRRNLDLKLFELRKVFLPVDGKPLPEEKKMLAGIAVGRRFPEQWNQTDDRIDIFDLKGVLEVLMDVFGIKNFNLIPSDENSCLHPGCSGDILVDNLKVGYAGRLHPLVQESFEVEEDVYIFEMGIECFVSHVDYQRQYKPYSRQPAVQRDIALVLDEAFSYSQIVSKVKEFADNRVTKIDLFDIYTGTPIPAGKKSMALRITYQDQVRNLTDEEINNLQEILLKGLLPALQAQLR